MGKGRRIISSRICSLSCISMFSGGGSIFLWLNKKINNSSIEHLYIHDIKYEYTNTKESYYLHEFNEM